MTLPLYQQIKNNLELSIKQGKLKANEQLPTEKEISAEYQVSRITSKRALTELESQGLIYRIQGKGSFVASNAHVILNDQILKNRILFLLPFAHDLSLGNFNAGLQPIIEDSGFELIMALPDFLLKHSSEEILNEFDGIIFYPENNHDYLNILFDLYTEQFPMVLLDKHISEIPTLPAVIADNQQGGFNATTLLIELGHKNISYIFGTPIHPESVNQRYLGYLTALKAFNINFKSPFDLDITNLKKLLKFINEKAITGFICENDLVAIQLMKILKENGYSLPKDFSIIGFDDIQAAALVEPALTTIAQDFKHMGSVAGTLLLKQIKKETTDLNTIVPIKLIMRDSAKEI